MTTLTPGKLKNLEKLANKKGVIAAAAMDQRGSLQKAIAKEKGCDPKEITAQMMSEFKTAVTKVLTPHATAVLLDPEFGLEAARQRASNAGLLLSYESTGYDQTSPGRFPQLIPGWNVKKSIAAGANAVKILLYYSPFEQKEINKRKHDWVEKIGRECVENDIPYFLEFVGYATGGEDEKGIEYARKKPEIVTHSMEEFSKDRYHVDVLKVEVPINMKFVKGAETCKGESAYTRDEAKELFRKAAAVTQKPFIYLSAGVSDEEFRESLELALQAGVHFNGVLCGRATWKEGIPVYAKSGVAALERWLSDRGVQNIKALNAVLEKGAYPWHEKFGGRGKVEARSR
ncbi:MAG: tagatose 1,6-diphosphate aldolase [Deltaproteobacteria bacterium]|nr:tagatose 1,6-diphosphate aldolase [Deltaproteobacteria bacterium]MBI2500169.1 tagatose 1,6-diphosphate aldolase [Deltaproteobacteria bacterium]